MTPTPDLISQEDALSFFQTHATLREALEAFLTGARGGMSALSLFEVLEIIKDLIIFIADFVGQPHRDLPSENPELEVSETHTDPKDQRTYGAITQKVRFKNVPETKPGNQVLQRWFWNLFGKLHDLQNDEDSFTSLLKGIYANRQAGSTPSDSQEPVGEVPAGDSDEGNLVAFLASKLRKAKRASRRQIRG